MEFKQQKTIEWTCRIALTVQVLLILLGYLNFYQAKHDLESPLVPQVAIPQIASPYFKACLVEGLLLLAAMWFYFLRKKTATITVCVIGLLLFGIMVIAFAE